MSRSILYAICSLAPLHWAAGAHLALELSANGHAWLAKDDKITKIPWQLVMTGKEESLDQLPSKLQANVKRTLALNPGMKIHYLSDRQCRMYVRQHCDDEIAEIYNAEKAGHFRGDICRAAVLLEEGGFYADLDLEPTVPFKSLVDDSTKFMSVFTHDGAVLNALMAAVPGSPVMKETLQEVLHWYRGGHSETSSDGSWMGTVTLMRALRSVMKKNCPQISLDSKRQSPDMQWQCGKHDFRFYHEDKLKCNRNTLWRTGAGNRECPFERMQSDFPGLKYGIFKPGPSRELIAWPRTVACDSWWCGGR